MTKHTSIVDISGRVLARNTIIEVKRGDFVVIIVRYRYPKEAA